MPIINPIIHELDSLSEPAKRTLATAHQKIIGQQPINTPAAPGIQSTAPPIVAPAPDMASPQSAPIQAPTAPRPSVAPIQMPTANQKELDRLESSPSGIGGIKHAAARVPLQILDAIGGGLFPGIEMLIPGTQGHHNVLTAQARRAVTQDNTLANDQSQRTLEAAQTENTLDQPESRALTAENTRLRDEATARNTAAGIDQRGAAASASDAAKSAKRKADLHAKGYDEDDQGNIVPLSRELLSPQALAEIQDKESLDAARRAAQELNTARIELVKAQTANVPAQLDMAKKRLQSAQESHAIALRRLNLSEQQTEARLHGTQGGEALPGAMLTEDGTPVGTALQTNVRPTGAQRGKADLANSAEEQVGDLLGIVKARPDIFGPAAGRKTQFETWIGSQDPDAQRFRAARTIAADHLAGVFGGRSQAALEALDEAIGQFKDNPEAIEAGMQQVLRGNRMFQRAGTVRTAPGGGSPKTGKTVYNPATKKLETK